MGLLIPFFMLPPFPRFDLEARMVSSVRAFECLGAHAVLGEGNMAIY